MTVPKDPMAPEARLAVRLSGGDGSTRLRSLSGIDHRAEARGSTSQI